MRKSILALVVLIYIICFNCQSDKCIIIENHEGGEVKSILCIVDQKAEYFCYKDYFENGQLEARFCLEMGKPKGTRMDYYPTGGIKSILEYKNGVRQGLHTYFYEDGRKDFFNYYVDDKPIYGQYYRYDTLEGYFDKVFAPFVEMLDDTITLPEEYISFRVTLPIPDSIIEQTSSIFKYGFKPLSLKDSTIYTPKYETIITYDKAIVGKIKVEKPGQQVFYGYIAEDDNGKVHAFSPFEEIITVLPDSMSID